MATDLELLRAHEPIIRFTNGELFLPTSVEGYVAACSLWENRPNGSNEQIAAPSELDLDRLAEEGRRGGGRALSLRFVQAPLSRSEYRAWRKTPRPRLGRGGRFQTVGYVGRLIDGAFRATLLARGSVPGGHIASAETTYREQLRDGTFPYYGHVSRVGGYIVLQYWYFYAMNDWRSTFGGVNDHEADWEMACVFLSEGEDGDPVPEWVALSNHDFTGDDLRRRWDDPDLQREGMHPIGFAGAGSHSGAFIPGDYVTRVHLPVIDWFSGLTQRARTALRRRRGLPAPKNEGFGIPYVDYARGDGVSIGPGQDHEWTPVVIDDETPWVRDFRGLWGLDTGDPFGGERAPAGPRYERERVVRGSWADPVAWAGLQKVPPGPSEYRASLQDRISRIGDLLAEQDHELDKARTRLRAHFAARESLSARGPARAERRELSREIAHEESTVEELIAKRSALVEERRLHQVTLDDRLPETDPHAHLVRAHGPYQPRVHGRQRFLTIWAAISAPLLIASLILVLLNPVAGTVATFTGITLVFAAVEAWGRGRLLALVAVLVGGIFILVIGTIFVGLLIVEWRLAIIALLAAIALALLITNVRELVRH